VGLEHRIVLVDPYEPPDRSLGQAVARCGYAVRLARDIDGALQLLNGSGASLVVLRLADRRGVELCRSLRLLSEASIVGVYTGRNENLIVRCLDAGADTVLAGPLSRCELQARLTAVLSRQRRLRQDDAGRETYRIADLTIDATAHTAMKGSRPVSLTPTEFRLLVALARRAGSTVSHSDLLSEVWGDHFGERPETLRLYVSYLRQKLDDTGEQPRLLMSERGLGYRLAVAAAAGTVKGHVDEEDEPTFAGRRAGTRGALLARRALAAISR